MNVERVIGLVLVSVCLVAAAVWAIVLIDDWLHRK
jgi:hypothetical protein